jgi:hypothetical protein
MEWQCLDQKIYVDIEKVHGDLSDNWDTIEVLGQEYHLVEDEQPKLVKYMAPMEAHVAVA